MACSINLFNALSTSGPAISNSGTWYFIGYNATTAAGPWTWVSGMPSGLPAITPPTSGWMGGYNQTVNFTGVSALGYYKFEYRTGTAPCTDVAELIIEAKPNAFPGLVSTRYVCPAYGSGTWTNYFNSGVGTGSPQLGTLSVSPTTPGFITGGNTINPSAAAPGTYTLTNTLTVTPSYSTNYPAPTGGAICPSCQYGTFSANSTIVVQPDPVAAVIDTCVSPPTGEWTMIDIGELVTSLPSNTDGKWYISSYNGGGTKFWRINGVIVGYVFAGAAGTGAMWTNTSVFDNVFEVLNWTASNQPITLNFMQGHSFFNNPGIISGNCMLNTAYTFDIGDNQLDGHFYTDMGNCLDYSNWQINKFWTNATINDQSGATEWVGGTPISMGTLTPTTVNSTTYFTNFMNTANSIGVPGFTFSVPNIFTPTATGGCSVGWTSRVRVQSTFTGNWVIEWEDTFSTRKFRAEHVAGVLNTYRWNGSSWVAWVGYYSVPNVVTTYTTC